MYEISRERQERRKRKHGGAHLDPRDSHQSQKLLAFIVVFLCYLDLTTREFVDVLGSTWANEQMSNSANVQTLAYSKLLVTHQSLSLQLRPLSLLACLRNASWAVGLNEPVHQSSFFTTLDGKFSRYSRRSISIEEVFHQTRNKAWDRSLPYEEFYSIEIISSPQNRRRKRVTKRKHTGRRDPSNDS